MMVKVKICGITNAQDALAAVRAGADVLGFNFYRSSPRYVPPEKAKPILLTLPPFVSTVGLFVDAPVYKMVEIMELCELDFAQLHGYETPGKVARLKGMRVLKGIRVRSEEDVRRLEKYRVDGYVLDAYVPGEFGGTGKTFNWELARAATQAGNIILAGGLTPDNVAEAVSIARPYGVDVASGVEDEPGKKSRKLMEEFIRRAKEVQL